MSTYFTRFDMVRKRVAHERCVLRRDLPSGVTTAKCIHERNEACLDSGEKHRGRVAVGGFSSSLELVRHLTEDESDAGCCRGFCEIPMSYGFSKSPQECTTAARTRVTGCLCVS